MNEAVNRLELACRTQPLSDVLEANGVAAVLLHGSAARPAGQEPRDLDIAVWCGGSGPGDLLQLLGALTDAADHELDLAVLDWAPVPLVAAAVTGVPLFERAPGTIAELQMRFIPQSLDTAWLRRLRLVQLAGS
jgi:predicted nucleotidyltransferase